MIHRLALVVLFAVLMWTGSVFNRHAYDVTAHMAARRGRMMVGLALYAGAAVSLLGAI